MKTFHKVTALRPILAVPAIFIALSVACGIEVVSPTTSQAPPTAISAPTATAPVPVVPPTMRPCPSGKTVELSILIEPVGSGRVEIEGSPVATTGGATPVCADDQINLIARPVSEKWRFDHWEGDVNGPLAAQAILTDSSKVFRAVFVEADTPRP